MKNLQILTITGGLTLAAVGMGLALANPSQRDYERYAVEQLTIYIKSNLCTQAPKNFGGFLQQQCATLVDTGRPQIQQVISQTTQRQNFILFSIYKTDLSFSPLLPAYHFETVAVLQNFYLYQADKK